MPMYPCPLKHQASVADTIMSSRRMYIHVQPHVEVGLDRLDFLLAQRCAVVGT